jgi:hypothetical protein
MPFGVLRGNIVQVTVLKAATFSLFFLPLTAASVHAQAPPSARPEARSPLSEIAHDVSTWLSHVTGTGGADHRRAASSAPLPRARPTELAAPAPVVLNKESAELAHAPITPKKKAPVPVLIND